MAGTTYDMTNNDKIRILGETSPGISPILITIDFTVTPVNATDDNWKILELKDNWILHSGFTRCTASSSAATVDIGTAEDGTELDTAIDISSALTDWTVMDTLKDGTKVIITDDPGYIWLDFNSAAVSDGILEILLYIQTAPGEDHEGL